MNRLALSCLGLLSRLCLAFAVAATAGAEVPIRVARPIPPGSFTGGLPRGERVYLFDMGTASSPVRQGFTRVLRDDLYSREKGFGFESRPAAAEHLTDDITTRSDLTPQPFPARAAVYGVDDLTCDYVADGKIAFVADVKPGNYDVVAVVGHMFPVYHVSVKVNGREVLHDTDIFTYHHYRRGHRDDGAFGAWYKVWAVADATDGRIRIETYGDTSAGKRQFPLTVYEDLRQEVVSRETYSIAGPYKQAGLMGVVIVPRTEPPVVFAGDRLAAAPGCPRELAGAIDAFNGGRVDEVGRLLAGLVRPDLQFGRGMLYMALAGTPLLDQDWEMLDAAQSALKEAVRVDPANYTARLLLAQCEQFFAGINLFVDRRNVAGTELSATGRFHRMHALHRQFPPDHPFHLKALLYRGRAFRALVPFVKTAKSWEGLDALSVVEKGYPKNRYVRLFLHEDWSTEDWPLDPYASPPATPAWADELRRAFGQGIDFGDWWARHGQAEDGAIGGGWTDDVEVMPFWGLLSLIDPGAMPRSMAMLDKFTAGLWRSEFLDRERVFEPQFADAEHSAEPSGDGINYLIGVKYGHPLWVERNMLHAKLNRDFLTGINERGWRLYRSGDMSASRYAANHDPAAQLFQNEDAICLRAFRSVPWLVWYNANPAALKLLLEKADACRAIAMGTESGKPRGVIPSAVMWDGRPGGHEHGHGAGSGDSGGYTGRWYRGGFEGSWPGTYMSHYVNLLLAAFVAGGDRKYLEPFFAQYEFVRSLYPQGGFEPFANPPEGTDRWVANALLSPKGGLLSALLQVRLLTGERAFDALLAQKASGYDRYRLTGDKAEVVKAIKATSSWVRRRWPHMTTEASQTDRIAYDPQMVDFYLGADAQSIFQGLPLMAVTYANAGKDFAALVERASLTELKQHLYSFHAASRKVGLRLWLLEAGGEYELRYGVDADDNGSIDQPLGEKKFTVRARGMQVDVELPPHKIVTVEVRQTRAPGRVSGAVPADLAVCDEDIRLVTIPAQAGTELDLRVHNIGGTDAENVVVETWVRKPGTQPELVETGILSRVPGAVSFDPQYTRLGVWGHRGRLADGDTVIVKVDPGNLIPEINEENNVAERVVRLSEAPPEPKVLATASPAARGDSRGGRPPAAQPPARPVPAGRPAQAASGDTAAELAKFDRAGEFLPASGPAGTEWDADYRSFIQTDESAIAKGLPSHAAAAARIKADAAADPARREKHKGWVLFIKHHSQKYRPEQATADLRRLHEELVEMGAGRPEAKPELPFEGDPRLIIHRDVAYGSDAPARQNLDAYLVKSPRPTPVLIEVHGGGWRRGAKSQFVYAGDLMEQIIRAGISVVSINYRLTPEHRFPAQMEDIARAVQFVRSRAREWNLDPDRIAAMGGSAGGHLSAWLALHDELAQTGHSDLVRRQSTRLRGAVVLWAPVDLTRVRPTELARQPSRGQDFANAFTAAFGCTEEEFEKDPAVRKQIREASPLFLVTPDDPPLLVMGPSGDEMSAGNHPPVPEVINDPHSAWHGVLLADALRGAGVGVTTRIGPFVGKDTAGDSAAILEYLRRRLLQDAGR